MSKFELRKAAADRSGVTYEASIAFQDLTPSVYDRIGQEDGCRRLSQRFYDRVFADHDTPWFLSIFSSSTKQEAIENQYKFLVQTFGGPNLYQQAKGKYTRLVGRHANYAIGHAAADRWVYHMVQALGEQLPNDDEARQALTDYFTYTAHYIVVASEFMRPDQLSGGTQIDAGRIW